MTLNTVYSGNEARGFVARKAAGVNVRPRAWLGPSVSEYDPDTDSGDGVECPWEGCDSIFPSDQGMKSHHKLVHGESIAGAEVDCDWCGKTKTVVPALVDEYEHHFCDNDCKGAWQAANLIGEDANNWRGGPAVEPCANCGEDVERKQATAEKFDKAFCDFSCRDEWREDHYNGENNPNYDRVLVECSRCGDEMAITRSRRDSSVSIYCSEECNSAARSERYSGEGNPMYGLYGEDHPAWTAGRFSYGKGWTDGLKENIRESQDRCCANCGSHESDTGESLHVHHIQKARSFENPEARNDESNLVALCRPCHRRWEQMSPLRPQTPHLD